MGVPCRLAASSSIPSPTPSSTILHATYARLRDEAPVYLNEKYGFYALSRHADVVAAHGDPVRFVSSYGVTLELLLQKQPMNTNMMIVMDPPEHTQMRKLVSQAFSRNAIGSLEPLVGEIIATYLDALVDRNEFDLVAEFAALFPVEVISAILGVPEGERQQVRLWVDMFLHREEGNPNTTHEGMEATLHMAGYFLDLARTKRRRPDGLLISKLTEAVVLDEEGQEHRLSDEDVAAFSVLIAGAGSETVTKLIGSGVVLFDQHPGQWELVQNDRALIPHAVEEILRMHPPSQYQGRFATAPVEFDGGTIPAESPVILLTGAATRDPGPTSDPTLSTSRGADAPRWPLAMACMGVSAPGLLGWSPTSPSRESALGGPISRSSTTACEGSIWRMSPGTPTSRWLFPSSVVRTLP